MQTYNAEMKAEYFLPSQQTGFVSFLQSALKGPLPGLAAQCRMAPQNRAFAPEAGITPRRAGVLIPIYPDAHGEIKLIFTLRPQTLNQHAGEVSFPGGSMDPYDYDLKQTALRETREELDIPESRVQVLGALTPLYISNSRYLLYPFVGWLSEMPPLRPSPCEIAEVYHVPLNRLRDPATRQQRIWKYKEEMLSAPVYQFPGFFIWGATAMVVSEFLTIVEPYWKGQQ